MRLGELITGVQWIFNDTFLSVVTASGKVILMDALCNVFSLLLPYGDTKRFLQPFVKASKVKMQGTLSRLSDEGMPTLSKAKSFALMGQSELCLVLVDTTMEHLIKPTELL